MEELLNYHKKQVKILANLISRKEFPAKKGTMYFGTWIDAKKRLFWYGSFPG